MPIKPNWGAVWNFVIAAVCFMVMINMPNNFNNSFSVVFFNASVVNRQFVHAATSSRSYYILCSWPFWPGNNNAPTKILILRTHGGTLPFNDGGWVINCCPDPFNAVISRNDLQCSIIVLIIPCSFILWENSATTERQAGTTALTLSSSKFKRHGFGLIHFRDCGGWICCSNQNWALIHPFSSKSVVLFVGTLVTWLV